MSFSSIHHDQPVINFHTISQEGHRSKPGGSSTIKVETYKKKQIHDYQTLNVVVLLHYSIRKAIKELQKKGDRHLLFFQIVFHKIC